MISNGYEVLDRKQNDKTSEFKKNILFEHTNIVSLRVIIFCSALPGVFTKKHMQVTCGPELHPVVDKIRDECN
jgi:hypothetical protein